ncbi:hypothetical protein TanjilG_05585 [Lupinus angustifolius]|uniref:Cytochrome b5 heme-binding domain-containing protein n=1 Tax=Lupinus angustifolius TaxID=3871 RepID=A0A4P1QSD1_LUPAN|nr:PREDICTED: cytochrome b5-like [Lupinus angustifolius]XP_019420585.1 PREDICTED: cytochrome b5-like [Lupinus angustifolius]OIV93882.1 hypothetical protein TanjilG_05585 [Lupinus angustifolius]
MTSNSKVFTFEEVAKHNHKNDCWIIVNGKVYDVTPFLDDHPGGDEVILSATEKDATIDFEDVGHSDSAIEDMQKYYVGEFDANTLPAEVDNSTPPSRQAVAPNTSNQSSGFVLKILQYVLPMLILASAYALQYYGKSSKPNES